MPSNKPTISKLTKTRDELIEAQEALASLADRPLPASEAIERAAALVDSQAAAFQAGYKAQVFTQLGTDLAQRDLFNLTAINQGALQNKVEAGPMICWLHGDAIKAKLKAEIEAMNLDGAVPLADREPERQRLESEIQHLEIEEELLLRALEQAGEQVERRADASIEIILAPDAELSNEPMEKAA